MKYNIKEEWENLASCIKTEQVALIWPKYFKVIESLQNGTKRKSKNEYCWLWICRSSN